MFQIPQDTTEKQIVEKQTGRLGNIKYGYIDRTSQKVGIDIIRNLVTYIRPNDLTYEVVDALNILTIQDITKKSQQTSTAGSFKWKAQKYPGDIDMLEFYHLQTTDYNSALDQIVEGLVGVANDIKKNREVILADFKCGVDPRFKSLVHNLGQLSATYIVPDMVGYFERDIFGYNKAACEAEIQKLYEMGAIPKDVHDSLLASLPETMTGDDHANIYKQIRPYHLLRWLASDITNKAKVISPKVQGKPSFVVELRDAVQEDTVTKLDLWVKVMGRWTEMTNIYIFTYNGPDGEKTPIGFYFKSDVDEGTEIDIKYYSSPEHEKPFKLAKRIWNRAILKMSEAMDQTGNLILSKTDPTQVRILKKIFPLFSSDIIALGQMIADLELAVDAFEKKDLLNLTYTHIYKDLLAQIEEIPQKVFRIMLIKSPDAENIKEMVSKLFAYVNQKTGCDQDYDYRYINDKKWDTLYATGEIKPIIDMTQELFNYMTNIQNGYAKEYLIVTRLHPRVPNSLVYPKYTYNYLNLPPLTYGAPVEETQIGGSAALNRQMQPSTKQSSIVRDQRSLNSSTRGGNDMYYEKYIKYKTKYLMRK